MRQAIDVELDNLPEEFIDFWESDQTNASQGTAALSVIAA